VIGNQSYLIRSGSLLWPSGFPFTGPEVEVVSAAVRLRVLVGLLVLGCSGPTIPPERWQLAGRRPLGELVTDSAPTAVLVIDPGEYSRCLGIVAPWLEWRRSGAGRFLLLLSRPPDATERRILIAAGIRFDETIVRGPPADSTPMELVFRGGRILYADAGLRGPRSSGPCHSGSSRLRCRRRRKRLRNRRTTLETTLEGGPHQKVGPCPVPDGGGSVSVGGCSLPDQRTR
jgi:hypothetical protein